MALQSIQRQLRITAVIHNLSRGGAEKNFVGLINALQMRGHRCSVICLNRQAKLSETLNSEIIQIELKRRPLYSLPLILLDLRKAIESSKPDRIVSFMDQTNMLCLLALSKNSSTPLIVCERNNPARNKILGPRFPDFLQPLFRLLRNKLYKRAYLICAQTLGACNYFCAHSPGTKTAILSNFVSPMPIAPGVEREKIIICVARLVPEKGVRQVLEAFACIHRQHPEWRLEIYGEGMLKAELQQNIESLGLKQLAHLMGKVPDMTTVYQRAAILVLNSSYEGFPNALLEAMAAGCAVIASDCDFGPREIINDRQNGILVRPGDQEDLVRKLLGLIEDKELRSKLGQEAAKIAARFSLQNLVTGFEQLLLASE